MDRHCIKCGASTTWVGEVRQVDACPACGAIYAKQVAKEVKAPPGVRPTAALVQPTKRFPVERLAIGMVLAVVAYFVLVDDSYYNSEKFRTKLVDAVTTGTAREVAELLRKNRTDLVPSQDWGLLVEAMDTNKPDVLKLLLSEKSRRHVDSLAEWAISTNNYAAFEVLMASGASPDGRGLTGYTLLSAALLSAESGETAFVRVLEERASAETRQRARLEVSAQKAQSGRPKNAVPCMALYAYAEAQGQGFVERSIIVDNARRRGTCVDGK